MEFVNPRSHRLHSQPMPPSMHPSPTLRSKFLPYGIFLSLFGLGFQTAPQTSPQPTAPPSLEWQTKIFRNDIRPVWISNHQFWYEVKTGNLIREFVFVDGATKMRVAAPDLEGLQKRTGVPLLQSESTASLRLEPSSSTDNQGIQVAFKNETTTPVELYWLDANRRPQLYHTIDVGESITQSTFTGHTWFACPIADEGREKEVIWAKQLSSADASIAIRPAKSKLPFPRRRIRNAPSSQPASPDRVWQTSLVDHNLRFTNTQAPERSFSTTDFPSIIGTPSSRYVDNIVWSPDSRFAVFQQITLGQHREVTLVESSPKDSLQPRTILHRYDKPGDALDKPTLRVIDLHGTPRPIPIDTTSFPEPWSIDEIRWSADSSRFTFLYNQRGHQVLRLMAVDPIHETVKPLLNEESQTYIDYAAKSYHEYLDDSHEIVWASERDGWYHLYLFDADTGVCKNQITHGNWVVRSVEHIDRENRQLWFYASGLDPAQDPYYKQLCRVSLDGGPLTRITTGDGNHQCEFSLDRSYVIDTYSRVDMPPIRELRSTATGELVVALEQADISELLTAGWQPPERFAAKGRDGTTDIYGILVRPSNMLPGQKYPIIEEIYAGPQDSFVPKSFSLLSDLHALADKGFIVVKIDGMGTSNRSKAFHDVSYRNLSDGGFPDRIRWIQAAAAKYPELDVERVGIYGGSAGGQNALAAMLFHGDFYDAAVADCGCHDNRMDKVWWNELYMGWPIGDQYERNSNVVHANRLTGKLFLIVGELDTNVDPASTMQVVNALIQADKDFDLLVVPGGGHGIGSSSYGKRRRDDFFMRHLQSAKH